MKQWDIYEAALLLDMLIQIRNGVYPHKEGCIMLSGMLRQKAVNDGMVIDDVYRNYAGMVLQMLRLSRAWDGIEDDRKRSTVIFRQICEIYRSDYDRYCDALRKAIQMVSPASTDYIPSIGRTVYEVKVVMDKRKMEDNRRTFYDWLIKQVSSNQYTEMYYAVHVVNEWCKFKQLIQETIFEIFDADTVFRMSILFESDHCNEYSRGSRIIFAKDVLLFYSRFLNEQMTHKTRVQETVRSIVVPSCQQAISHTVYNTAVTKSKQPIPTISMPLTIRNEERRFVGFLGNQGMSDLDSRIVVSIARQVSEYLREEYGIGSLFAITDSRHASTIYQYMLRDGRFTDLNRRTNKVAAKVMNLYISYLKEHATVAEVDTRLSESETEIHKVIDQTATMNSSEISANGIPNQEVLISDVAKKRVRKILGEKFRKGFKQNSFIDVRRFMDSWRNEYGSDCDLNQEMIKCIVAELCIDTDGRWYLPESLLSSDDIALVNDEITGAFCNGKHTLFYESLYRSVCQRLSTSAITSDLFLAALKNVFHGKYYFYDRYLSDSRDARLDIDEEITTLLFSNGVPMTVEKICERLSHLPVDSVTCRLKENSVYIKNTRNKENGGEYFHIDMLPISQDEYERIRRIISDLVSEEGYACRAEVLRRFKKEDSDIIARLSPFSDSGIWKALERRLSGEFTFSGTAVAPLGECLTSTQMLALYCKRHVPFKWQEVCDFCRDADIQAWMYVACEQAFRVDRDCFVSKESVSMPIEEIDQAIELACPGMYAPILGVNVLDAFPQVGRPWNLYLLEQYLRDRSNRFSVMYGNNYSASGIIIRKGYNLEKENELIARILVDNNVPLDSKAAAKWLFENGYTPTSVKGWAHEGVMIRAREIRKEREE